MPVILATQALEAEIRRTAVQASPRQIVWRPYLENTIQKRTGGVAQVVANLKRQDPEFNPCTTKKKKFQLIKTIYFVF
jgi:hypothetical protein